MNAQKALEFLGQARDKNELVCIYRGVSPNRYALGFVDATSEEYVVIRAVSTHGRADGWALIPIEQICRIEQGGRYEENIAFLFRARQDQHKIVLLPALEAGADLRREILLAAHDHDLAVSLDAGTRSVISGFVKSVDLEHVLVQLLDENSHESGECLLELETVERVFVDDENLQDSRLIARWHEMEPPPW